MRERTNVTQQIMAGTHQAQRELGERIQVMRTPRPPPAPGSIVMRAALETFRRMEIQHEPNYITNSVQRPNRLIRSENDSLPRPNRPISPPFRGELPPRIFERFPPRILQGRTNSSSSSEEEEW